MSITSLQKMIQDAAEKHRREWVISVCQLVMKREPTTQELETLGKSAYTHAFANGIRFAVDNGFTLDDGDDEKALDAGDRPPEDQL